MYLAHRRGGVGRSGEDGGMKEVKWGEGRGEGGEMALKEEREMDPLSPLHMFPHKFCLARNTETCLKWITGGGGEGF